MCGRDLAYSVCVAGYPEGARGTQTIRRHWESGECHISLMRVIAK